MQTKTFLKTMKDGTEIWCNRWIPDDVENIKGIVQIHHGLSEHCMRYDRLGSVLADNGFVVNGYDVRGNGHTGELAEKNGNGKMDAIAKKHGDKIVLEDLHEIITDLKNEYKGKKVFLAGHSFGSFVSQAFIENYGNEIDGCILLGSAGPRKNIINAGVFVTKLCKIICGPYSKLKFLAGMSFAGYNDKVKNPTSDFAWLSKDPMVISMYEMDNWCGNLLTTSFFHDMMKILQTIHKPENMKKIPKDIPVYILYGSDDPVGSYGKTVKDLYDIYLANGMTKVELKCYEGDRHELLNEVDKETVENDIVSWLNKLL